jgi:hypothetical protein
MSKAPEKATLRQFLKDNEPLLTALGVTGALAGFFTSFTNDYGIYPALISFAMFLVLAVELEKSLFGVRNIEETFRVFKYLTFLLPPAVFMFIVQSYWQQGMFRAWFLPFLVIEAVALTIPATRKKFGNKIGFAVFMGSIIIFLVIYLYVALPYFPPTITINNGNQTGNQTIP